MRDHGGDLDGAIGRRVKALRAARGLSLDALAASAEVSRAMLSRIERGQSSGTAQLLAKVCAGLDVTLSSLLADAEAGTEPVSRRADQPVWRDPGSGYRRRAVSPPGTGSAVDVAEIDFPPGACVSFDNRGAAAVDQHLWVLDGTLEVEMGGVSLRLETGDCLRTRFDRPILFRNPTARPVRYAAIVHRRPGP